MLEDAAAASWRLALASVNDDRALATLLQKRAWLAQLCSGSMRLELLTQGYEEPPSPAFRPGRRREILDLLTRWQSEVAYSPSASTPPEPPTDGVVESVHETNESDVFLTTRQREVARLIAPGLSNKQIARELGVSSATVANHVEQIFRRRNANSRARVAAWAAERSYEL